MYNDDYQLYKFPNYNTYNTISKCTGYKGIQVTIQNFDS